MNHTQYIIHVLTIYKMANDPSNTVNVVASIYEWSLGAIVFKRTRNQ